MENYIKFTTKFTLNRKKFIVEKYVQIGDKKYLRVGDKLAEIDHFGADGKPVLKTFSTEVKHADGRVDVTIHVPCLQITAKPIGCE